MTTELHILAWTLVLAIVQILAHSQARNRETGTDYNTGPRDSGGPPVGKITGRLQRAKENLFETLPLFAAAVLVAHVSGREGTMTLWGAWLYLIARIIYVPLYTAGIPYARSLVWVIAFGGLVLTLGAILF